MPLEPGTTLGPYAVTAKIGEGGMGEVYRATDTKLDRDVALKVLPEHGDGDWELEERATKELAARGGVKVYGGWSGRPELTTRIRTHALPEE